jgi:hypothetical protein
MQFRWRGQKMHAEFWWGNLLESGYLEDGDERITLRWILG